MFIGLAKLSTAVLSAAGVEAADVWGLAIWSAIGLAVYFGYGRRNSRLNRTADPVS